MRRMCDLGLSTRVRAGARTCTRSAARQSLPPPCRTRVATRAMTLTMRTSAMSDERAGPRLRMPVVVGSRWRRCRSAAGARRSAASSSTDQNWLPITVKSSGAVSPATRAMATSTPVMIPPQRRAQHDLQRRAPARVAERERCLAQRLRYRAHHLLGGPRHERDHHRAERRRRRPARRSDRAAGRGTPRRRCPSRSTAGRSARRRGIAPASASFVPPCSARYRPAPMPTGSPISDAIPTRISVPTMAFAIPPPASPTGRGMWVKKPSESAPRAFLDQVGEDHDERHHRERRRERR